jgi:protein unc-45
MLLAGKLATDSAAQTSSFVGMSRRMSRGRWSRNADQARLCGGRFSRLNHQELFYERHIRPAWFNMSVDDTASRIETLLAAADDAIAANQLQKAAEALREASHLDPGNVNIKDRWAALQKLEAGGGDVPSLLQNYIGANNDDDGQKALQTLQTRQLPNKDAVEATGLLLNAATPRPLLDALTESLLSRNVEARKLVATRLSENATEVFELLYARGPETLNALALIPLENTLWSSKEQQTTAQRDLFRLSVATLIEAGAEHLERIMRCIARLLSAVPDVLADLVDDEVLDAILSSLDIRLPAPLRSQAILATSKLLEATKQSGEELFSNFITERVSKQTNNDLIIAFSAAAAVFPIIPVVTAKLFMIDGFIQQLVPNLERNWDDGAAGKR